MARIVVRCACALLRDAALVASVGLVAAMRSVSIALVGALALGTTSCLSSKGLDLEDATGVATCKVAKDPLNPLIVEWPATEKTSFATASQRGIVAVRYEGCTLRVLADCVGVGSYELIGSQPILERIDVENADELYAKLPLGAAGLVGDLSTNASLRLNYVSVGQRVASGPPAKWDGPSCPQATHFVRAITVGAYELKRVTKLKVAGGVDTPIAELGGGHTESTQSIRGSGDVNGCYAEPGGECNAVIQLSLTKADRVGAGSTKAGFGKGLGTVTDIPTVENTNVSVSKTTLQDLDLVRLRLFQDALRADKDDSQPPLAKAKRWKQLADYGDGEHDMAEQARTREQQWRSLHEAQLKRRGDLLALYSQYASDKSKLEQLLELDDEVVSSVQKDAYEREFEVAYAPFSEQLDEAESIQSSAVAPSASKPPADDSGWKRGSINGVWIQGEGGFMLLSLDEDQQRVPGFSSEHEGGVGAALVGYANDELVLGAMFRGGALGGFEALQFGGRLGVQLDTGFLLVDLPIEFSYTAVNDGALAGAAFGGGLQLEVPLGSVFWLGGGVVYNLMLLGGDAPPAGDNESPESVDGLAHGVFATGQLAVRID